MRNYLPLLFLLISISAFSQVPIELFQQFNGRYSHTAFGNTLNYHDNSIDAYVNFCDILPSSSATLTLAPDQNIIAAYMYWSGPINTTVTPEVIDDSVELNGTTINAEGTFIYTLTSVHRYYACYADVTSIVQGIGSGNYEVTELDLSFLVTSPYHCSSNGGNQTNYGGWAINVIYEQASLPYNQVSLFHGLDGVSANNNYVAINLTNLNVIDDDGAKIGFLAWEGDEDLAIGESLFINGNLISNPPLNPANNAFNGTNSYTGSSELNNMDLDFYNIEDNIDVGDSTALIELQSLADLVMINNVVTVLNSQLPDATIVIDDFNQACDNRTIQLDYTVYNVNSTEVLFAGTPIAFYADSVLIAMAETQNDIPIGGNEPGAIEITLSDTIPNDFVLTVNVDDDGTGNGTVQETNEINNKVSIDISLLTSPISISLPNAEACDEGLNSATFDLTQHEEAFESLLNNTVQYFETLDDAIARDNPILDPENYQNTSDPQTIYVRVDNDDCYQILTMILTTENCPPWVPSGFSPDGDGINDEFVIPGLVDVFDNFNLKIYNRYGTLIYEGGNELGYWDGKANRGMNNRGKVLPPATYYYVLYLNDAQYPEPLLGWVYINH